MKYIVAFLLLSCAVARADETQMTPAPVDPAQQARIDQDAKVRQDEMQNNEGFKRRAQRHLDQSRAAFDDQKKRDDDFENTRKAAKLRERQHPQR